MKVTASRVLKHLAQHLRSSFSLLLDPGLDLRFAMGGEAFPEVVGSTAQG